MGARPLLLVDTNVWMCNYVPLRAGHEATREFFRAAWESSAQLLYPAPILKDVFYLLGAEYKRQIRLEKGELSQADATAVNELAWGCVQNMRDVATAVGIDESDLWLACKYKAIDTDLEDNVVLAAAQRCEADYLVTFDQNLIRKATVSAMLPQDMVALLNLRT
ncbi:MAG: PIN domain-containing protein [Atopobiaceae bacterium]|nr:PIN domain-containing protein [Atopobiaceae bacterium]